MRFHSALRCNGVTQSYLIARTARLRRDGVTQSYLIVRTARLRRYGVTQSYLIVRQDSRFSQVGPVKRNQIIGKLVHLLHR
jgi:hypothetical protein